MKILIVTPTQGEIDCFLRGCGEQKVQSESIMLGKLPAIHFPELGVVIAEGGLGKAQFAVQTQHLIDASRGLQVVICAGAAGALADGVSVGDVVVATETVEHDIRNKFGRPLVPRFGSAKRILDSLQTAPPGAREFRVHFGPIASGDEDVIDPARRGEIQRLTGALAVAWEGAGGARACHFSEVPYVEIRGVTDNANSTAASDFEANLDRALTNVATLITSWASATKLLRRQAID